MRLKVFYSYKIGCPTLHKPFHLILAVSHCWHNFIDYISLARSEESHRAAPLSGQLCIMTVLEIIRIVAKNRPIKVVPNTIREYYSNSTICGEHWFSCQECHEI